MGTYNSAKVWQYEPENEKWTDLDIVRLESTEWFTVYGTSRFHDKLIISFDGATDSTNKETLAKTKLQKGDSWEDLKLPDIHYSCYDSLTVPFQFFKGVSNGDAFYGISGDGVWKLNIDEISWERLPSPPNSIRGE